MFKAFKPEAMNKIANAMGYSGDMNQFQQYIEQDPARQQQMNMYTNAAQKMAAGGMVKNNYQVGGAVTNLQQGSTVTNSSGQAQNNRRLIAPSPIRPILGNPFPQPLPQPYFPQPPMPINTNPGTGGALAQAYVPTQEFKDVSKPKIDNNQFLADGTTANPNYMKPILDADGNPIMELTKPTIGDVSAQMMQTPGLPTGATTVAQGINASDPSQYVSQTSGQVSGAVAIPTEYATTTTADPAKQTQANLTNAVQAAPAVNAALQATQAAQGTVDPQAQVLAAQQTATSVGNLQAAQGNATLMNNPTQRQIQSGELISGVADAQTAAQFTEQIQAAQATPSQQATVQGQLDGLMAQFQGGATPSWAAGAMRAATAAMAARGLGSSSLAGQAIVQAAMESA